MLSLSSSLWMLVCLDVCMCRTRTGHSLPPEFQSMPCAQSHPMTNSSSTACSFVLWLHQTSLDSFISWLHKKTMTRKWLKGSGGWGLSQIAELYLQRDTCTGAYTSYPCGRRMRNELPARLEMAFASSSQAHSSPWPHLGKHEHSCTLEQIIF